MRNFLIPLFVLLMISCKSSHLNPTACNENEKFKERFFYHIQYIDKNISVAQDAKFRESVIFISNYAPVSLNRIMNYSRTYPIGIYEQDRIKWIDWYEKNKCKNIQLKSSLTIPEVYREQSE